MLFLKKKNIMRLRCGEFKVAGGLPRRTSGRCFVVDSGDSSELNGKRGVIRIQVIIIEKLRVNALPEGGSLERKMTEEIFKGYAYSKSTKEKRSIGE